MALPSVSSTRTVPLRVPHGKGSLFFFVADFIAPGRCIKGPMNFDLGLDHPGNEGHGTIVTL